MSEPCKALQAEVYTGARETAVSGGLQGQVNKCMCFCDVTSHMSHVTCHSQSVTHSLIVTHHTHSSDSDSPPQPHAFGAELDFFAPVSSTPTPAPKRFNPPWPLQTSWICTSLLPHNSLCLKWRTSKVSVTCMVHRSRIHLCILKLNPRRHPQPQLPSRLQLRALRLTIRSPCGTLTRVNFTWLLEDGKMPCEA